MVRKRSAAEVEELEVQRTPIRHRGDSKEAAVPEPESLKRGDSNSKEEKEGVEEEEREGGSDTKDDQEESEYTGLDNPSASHGQSQSDREENNSETDDDNFNLERYEENEDRSDFDHSEPMAEDIKFLMREEARERLLKRREENSEVGSDEDYSPTASEVDQEEADMVNEEDDGIGDDYDW